MSHRALSLAALAGCAAAAVAAVGGCQDYNYNPVGSCLIQPGQKQEKLLDVTTADILFVVDDSGSMAPKQDKLALSFDSFINNLNAASVDRVSRGLEPFDFHIAVTSASVFEDYNGTMSTTFGCTSGVSQQGQPYPRGAFMSAGSNPKVIHFTKDLYQPTINNAAIATLINQFRENIRVGECGSGQEQHLQAGRLAMERVLRGEYGSEFGHRGAKFIVVLVADEDDCSNDQAAPIVVCPAGSSNCKPGNDYCVAERTKPVDQQRLFRVSDYDAFFSSLVTPSGETPSAAHPYSSLGAAFIVSAVTCADGSFAAADSCSTTTRVVPGVCPTNLCGAPQPSVCSDAASAGVRLLQLASAFEGRKLDVIEGTVCEADFGPLLSRVADLVKAPSALRLSSQPAASEVTVVRVVDSTGKEQRVCSPSPPASTATAGWWFIDCADTGAPPAVAPGPTLCVYINHASGNCEANPGETYSAEYLGILPAGGCPSPNTPQGALFCAKALVNPNATAVDAQAWTCYPTGTPGQGTCLCSSNANP